MNRTEAGFAGARSSRRRTWIVRRIADVLILVAAIILALPLIVPFS